MRIHGVIGQYGVTRVGTVDAGRYLMLPKCGHETVWACPPVNAMQPEGQHETGMEPR